MSVGIPDELYWDLTLEEVLAVLELIGARQRNRERNADLRAGLVAAMIVNTNPYRKKGARLMQPEDFVKGAKVPKRHMSVEEAQMFMDSWAQGVNKSFGEDNA